MRILHVHSTYLLHTCYHTSSTVKAHTATCFFSAAKNTLNSMKSESVNLNPSAGSGRKSRASEPRNTVKRHFWRALLIALLLVVATVKLTAYSPHKPVELHAQLAQLLYYRVVDDPVGDKIGLPTLHPSDEFRRTGSKAMVSSDVPLCSSMGKHILLIGGNAADAAVTVALCIGSINLHSSGIGGGGFIVSSKDGELISIDAREMAPKRAHKHMYDDAPLLAQFGGLAVAVPGELEGLYQLHVRHGSGKLTWAELFAPVIALNRRGWAASEIWTRAVHKIHELLLSRVPLLNDCWDFIYEASGELVDIGSWVRRPNYASTLEMIARNGSSAIFYDPNGPIAPRLVEQIKTFGGVIEPEDFERYSANVTPALTFNFTVNGSTYDLATTGGVSSGLALIAGLNFYTAVHSDDADNALSLHRLIEAMKWTSSARTYLGDLNATYHGELVERFSSPEWSKSLAENGYADNETYPWKHYKPQFEMTEPRGTLHFSIVDENGGAVGMTTTVNLLFGLLVYDNTTGIFLNDQMDDFSVPDVSNAFNLTPSVYNFVRPYMRPLSLTTPTIIRKDGELELVIGAAGGSRIVTAVLEAIVRTIFQGMPLLDTISFPRLHHQLIPEFVMVEDLEMLEDEYGKSIQADLHAKGHSFYESGALTAMNGIKRANGQWEGVSDYWRKRGVADGY